MTDKATPRPWKEGFRDGNGSVGDDGPEHGGYITACDREETVVVRGGDYEGIAIGVISEADMKLIIDMVNSHDHLRQLLEEAKEALENYADRRWDNGSMARNTLAKLNELEKGKTNG